MGMVEIPRLGVEQVFVEGSSSEQTIDGPGLRPTRCSRVRPVCRCWWAVGPRSGRRSRQLDELGRSPDPDHDRAGSRSPTSSTWSARPPDVGDRVGPGAPDAGDVGPRRSPPTAPFRCLRSSRATRCRGRPARSRPSRAAGLRQHWPVGRTAAVGAAVAAGHRARHLGRVAIPACAPCGSAPSQSSWRFSGTCSRTSPSCCRTRSESPSITHHRRDLSPFRPARSHPARPRWSPSTSAPGSATTWCSTAST